MVCFNIVTSEASSFKSSSHVAQPALNCTPSIAALFTKEASGRHLLRPALILLVLFSTFLDQRQKQDRPSFLFFLLFVYLKNAVLFHSKTVMKKKESSPFRLVQALAVV